MDFRQHDDMIIELRLTDRRGRPIRASVCNDLKIRVWTQDPRNYVSFYPRDIRHEDHKDMLVMTDFVLSVLQPGVIIYRYSYREPFGHGSRESYEWSETVVTEHRWRGMHRDPMPSNPVNAHSLEHLRRIIEDVQRELTREYRDLKRYIESEYSGNLEDETARAKKAEEKLTSTISEVREKLEEEIKRSTEIDAYYISQLTKVQDALAALETTVKDGASENADTLKSLGETINESLEELEKTLLKKIEEDEVSIKEKFKAQKDRIDNIVEKQKKVNKDVETSINDESLRAKKEESRIEEKIEKVKSSISGEVSQEVTRAKSEEDRLDTRIDNLKAIVKGNTSSIESETQRAKLVEKDLAESLQRLKQSVADGSVSYDEALNALKNELKQLVDYRIQEIVGEAPAALDTLEEIAEKLMQDDDIFKAIREILLRKANEDDVYKKTVIDSRFSDIQRIIAEEKARAELEEKKHADAIAIINGDKATIGSILHAMDDANHYTDDVFRNLLQEVKSGYVPKEVMEQHIKEAEEALAGKQPLGDYVEYTTADGRKCVIFPNHCNLVGRTQDGTDGRNLIMLSKWNVCDVGSANNPVNLNGLNKRPTYNDDKELALIEDLKTVSPDTVKSWFQ